MHYFPALLTREQSDALAECESRLLTERGWGLWAVEVIEQDPFIGYVGLTEQRFQAHFTPAIDVGWRLAQDHWGKGYATEAAQAALAFGFDELGLHEIVSLTTISNERSQRVMERMGMTHDPADDFNHPLLAPGHPLRPHVLYRLHRTNRDILTRPLHKALGEAGGVEGGVALFGG
jgi:RimJ/RimL family protein N-acetyltransferase